MLRRLLVTLLLLLRLVALLPLTVVIAGATVVKGTIPSHLISAGLTKPMPQLNTSQQKTENSSSAFPFLKRSATTPQKGALQNSMK